MSSEKTEKTGSNQISKSSGKRFGGKWLDPKRKRFWAIILVLLYTLCGFYLVPVLVEKQLVKSVRQDLGREASVGEVQFNPYVLSLRLKTFQLKDTDDAQLASFDEFFVNFQLSSLFRWAWTFREIHLDGLFFHLERFAPGDSRLSRLLADAAARKPAEDSDSSEPGGLPRLLVHDLSFDNGKATFVDHVPESMVELAIGPISISMQELNTLPDRYGQQSVDIRFPEGATLGWQGSISLAPLESEGTLTISGSRLDQAIAYMKAVLPLEAIAATLSMNTKYRINELADGGLEIELDGLGVELKDISVSGLTPVTEFLTVPSFALQEGTLRYPENELNFARLNISEPGLTAWLDESGRLSLSDLVPGNQSTSPDKEAGAKAPDAWKLGIGELILDGGHLNLSDNSISPPAPLALEDLQLTLSNISNTANQSIPFSLSGALQGGGNFGLEGQAVVLPEISVSGQTSFTDIPLDLAQPYVEQKLSLLIENGTLSSEAGFAVETDQVMTVNGSLAVAGLKTLDTAENEDLLAWEMLDIDQFEVDASNNSLRFSRVVFEQLYGRLEINQDRSTNISGLLKVQNETDAKDQAAPWSIVVGGVAVNNGVMDFSDLSLPLPFGTRISDLDGTVSTIDTGSTEPANIRMEGQVDEFGLARIDGSMSVFEPISHTDISVEFRNLLMSNLSPYSVQFAGREIDEGKLDMDLNYVIQQGKLQGQNDIVLSDLLLGAEVDSPDAVSLPLGLAVALLKDANGVIDIDLPVEGDINDPEFRIGGIVMKAIVGLITKVVSAPFRMLGALIGVDSEDFGQFQFLAGRSELTPPELEKIAQLQLALQERPELGIELSGVYDPSSDTAKLQFFRLRDTVMERLGKEPSAEDPENLMLDEEIRSVLEQLFEERFPAETTDSMKAANSAPPADDPEGKPVLDALAYAGSLRDRLLASEEISIADLEALAQARAEAIRAAFLASGEFDESRIVIAAPTEVESEDGEWVLMELGVSAD